MASEPELRSGSSGEWVLYLQQTLNHHYQQQVTDESGEFDTALESVIQHFQRQQGIEPTGVVDDGTWQALTGEPGVVAAYVWPDSPVAGATVDVDDGVVELALTLTGEAPVVPIVTVDLPSAVLSADDATFEPATVQPESTTCVELTGACQLAGAAAPGTYRLTVTVSDGLAPADEWLTDKAHDLTAVPLVATADPVRIGG